MKIGLFARAEGHDHGTYVFLPASAGQRKVAARKKPCRRAGRNRPVGHRAAPVFVTGRAYQIACRLPKTFSFLSPPTLDGTRRVPHCCKSHRLPTLAARDRTTNWMNLERPNDRLLQAICAHKDGPGPSACAGPPHPLPQVQSTPELCQSILRTAFVHQLTFQPAYSVSTCGATASWVGPRPETASPMSSPENNTQSWSR